MRSLLLILLLLILNLLCTFAVEVAGRQLLSRAIRAKLGVARLDENADPERHHKKKKKTPTVKDFPARKLTIVNDCSGNVTARFTSNALPLSPSGDAYDCRVAGSSCREVFKSNNPLVCGVANGFCYFALELGPRITLIPKQKVEINFPRTPVTVGVRQSTGLLDLQNTIYGGKIVGATECAPGPDASGYIYCVTGTEVESYYQASPTSSPVLVSPWLSGVKDKITSFELSAFSDRQDTYDIQVLEGFNLPVAFGPDKGSYEQFLNNGRTWFQNCSSIGGISSNIHVSDCTWNLNMSYFSQPSIVKVLGGTFNWPSSQSVTFCGGDLDCAGDANGNNVCGLWIPNEYNANAQMVCGPSIRYLVLPNGFCAYGYPFNEITVKQGVQALYDCNSKFVQTENGPVPLSDTQTNVFGCEGNYLSSPYNPPNGLKSCGFPYWANGTDQTDFKVLVSSFTEQAASPGWLALFEPNWLETLKRACPMSYGYPFDDKSSTFGCGVLPGETSLNSMNYTLTFCPNQNQGPFDPFGAFQT